MTKAIHWIALFLLSLLLIGMPALAQVQAVPAENKIIDRLPTASLKKRVEGAQAIFVGVLVNRVEAGEWVEAELKVDEALRGVKDDENIKVTWRRYLGRREIYNADEGDVGLAILDAKHDGRYWLRADKFESVEWTGAVNKLLQQPAAVQQKQATPQTLSVAGIFGSGMVLQQQTKAAIWGQAKPGSKVSVKPSWLGRAVSTSADAEGNWKTFIKTPKAGGPFTLAIASGQQKKVFQNILSGEVWICGGQSNMQWKMRGFGAAHWKEDVQKANHPNIRFCQVPQKLSLVPQRDTKAPWSVCNPRSVTSFSAVGYFFGEQLHRELGVPIGLISSNWGGSSAEAWVDEETIASEFPEFAQATAMYPQLIKEHGAVHPMKRPKGINQRMPSVLYNNMIGTIKPYSMRGVIWYQGESNVTEPIQYRKLFPAVIKNWRQQWGQGDFPFYYVQIAPFKYKNNPYPVAMLREAQLQALSVPNTGMAVTMDVGNPENIHPKPKKPVADRLARLALKRVYGRSKIVDSGPQFVDIETKAKQLRIEFKDIGGGLATRDGKAPSHFQVAGEDKVFHEAEATIDGDSVVVSSEKVRAPIAVRYAWGNADEPNLMNQEGLPCSSFRSDDWEIPATGKSR